MKHRLIVLASSLVAAFAALASCAFAAEDWGAKGSFAVVHPIVRSEYAQVKSLAGKWDFINDYSAVNYRTGLGRGWDYAPNDWSGYPKLDVPGVWEAQGIGEPGKGRTWDCLWDCGIWELNNLYVGRALYHTTFDVPKEWANGRVWLKIGGVGSCGYFWVNGERAAFVQTYCGARKFDVTSLVKFGEKNDLLAQVRNDVPSRLGELAVNEHFGGIFRDVEVEYTPNVYVDDVWARGDVANKAADVRVYVKGTDENGDASPIYDDELSPNDRDRLAALKASGLNIAADKGARTIDGLGSIEVSIKTIDGKVVGRREIEAKTTSSENGLANAFRVSVPIENCQLWTPETPNLYLADVVIKNEDGAAIHGWTERFGVRELKAVGRQFFLNGRPYFLRGSGDHNSDQLNLIKMGDFDKLRSILSIFRESGFNYMRHHTHSPLPEYFEIADEKGILLEPELPYYHDVPCEGFDFDPKRDMFELWRTNRRYTSFATYSYGNEGFLGHPLDVQMYDWVKTYDPDRLVIHQDGGPQNRADNSDFTTSGGDGTGWSMINPWAIGAIDNVDRPFVAHEYLNLSIKMDPRLESRFTGVRKSPVDYKAWLDKLEKVGLDEKWGAGCLDAAAKLQAIYQKKGLEAARLDPACDGYIFWSVTDVALPQGDSCTAQGFLTPFWEQRHNGLSPKEFDRFNGPSALLISYDKPAPIFENGDKFNVEFKISHFDAYDIPAGSVEWKVVSDADKVLANGSVATDKIEAGFAGKIADCAIELPNDLVAAPTAAKFVVSVAGTKIANSWDCWFFPKRAKRSLKGFAVSKSWTEDFAKYYDDVKTISEADLDADEAKDNDVWIVAPTDVAYGVALKQGRRVFALSRASGAPNVSLGWWSLGEQVGATFADSPAFDGFPNTADMTELWFRLIRTGAPDLKNKPFGDAFEPLAIGESASSYVAYLAQTKIGSARVLASYAIDLTRDVPEATALLDSLLAYVASDKFDPQTKTNGLKVWTYKAPKDVDWGFGSLVEMNDELLQGPSLYEDLVSPMTCRQTSKDVKLVWRTAPKKNAAAETTTFKFVGGIGYWSQPQTDGFEMTIDGKTTIRFDLPDKETKVGDKVEWKSQDGEASLTFEVGRKTDLGPDFFGVYTLTVPTKALDADADAATISVVSLGEKSRRWFSLYDYPGLGQEVELK